MFLEIAWSIKNARPEKYIVDHKMIHAISIYDCYTDTDNNVNVL